MTKGVFCAAGYSAIELMLVVGLMSVVGSMAVFELGNARPVMKGDGAMRVLVAQLNTARERSITERRTMQVKFNSPNQVQIIRQEVPGGTTVLSTVPFEGGVEYGLVTGVGDTPDQFGQNSATDFGTATTMSFTTDGTFIDDQGRPLNGTVFVALPNQARSARAVTILGATGRIRAYRWDGKQWKVM